VDSREGKSPEAKIRYQSKERRTRRRREGRLRRRDNRAKEE